MSPAEAAIELAERGYRVLPCWPVHGDRCACGRNCDRKRQGKHPLHHAVPHGALSASSDPLMVAEWWKRWPSANVAVATDGLLVVDIDTKEAFEQFTSLANAGGGFQSPPPITRTGRGGLHIWLRTASPLPNAAAVLSNGIDVRGAGGYVLVPPSINGHGPYRWVPERSLYEIEPPGAPTWLLELLRRASAPPDSEPIPLRRALSGYPEGQRQTQLFRYACSLRARGVSEDEALVLVDTAASRCEPPFSSSDAAEIVQRVYRRYPPRDEGHQLRLVPASSIQADTQRWLWRPILPQGELIILASPPGVGKTTLALSFAARISSGQPWPDGRQSEPRPALIVSVEDHPARVVIPRLRAMGADLDRCFLLDRSPLFPSDIPDFCRQIEAIRPGIVILDPIMALFPQSFDSYRDSSVRSVLAPLIQSAHSSDSTILAVMHFTKGSASVPAQYRVGGSIAFTGASRHVLSMSRHPHDRAQRILSIVKSNLAELSSYSLPISSDSETTSIDLELVTPWKQNESSIPF